jgi:hypothetical protein
MNQIRKIAPILITIALLTICISVLKEELKNLGKQWENN